MADDKIEKLNDHNFEIWKFKMELKLTKEKLIKVVREPKPTVATGSQAGEGTVTATEMAAWLEKDGDARHAIGMAVENDQLVHICRKTTAKEMWDTLLGIHEVESMNTMMTVMRKMCSQKLPEDGNLPEHLKELTAMHNRLEVADEGLKPRQFVAVMLSSLPMSYGTLINVIEGYPKEQITVDFVKSKLRDEWRRRQECQEFQSGPSDEKALKVSAKSDSGGKPKAADLKKKSVLCHFCQEEGHFIRDCPLMAKMKEVLKSEGSAKVNLVAEVRSDKEVCLMAMAACESNRWYLDSGATSHMTSDKSVLSNWSSAKQPEICLADGTKIVCSGTGSGKLVSVADNGDRVKVTLNDIIHVPSLAGNLLSVSKICDLGFEVLFHRGGCKILRGQEAILVGERHGGLYRLKQYVEKALLTNPEHPQLCEHLWHRRLGHRDPDAISAIVREELGFGLKMKKCDVQCVCGVCCEGKMSRLPFPKESVSKTQAVGDLVHSDLGGPMEVATPGGNRYFMTMVDDFSGYTVIYLLKAKSEAESKIREYFNLVKNQFGRPPRVLRTDGGGEYSGSSLKKFLAESGTIHQMTAPYSPQQNGKAERKNRYAVEMVRCMLSESGLGKQYWGEAMTAANYLQNRLPSSSVEKTPFELWHNKKPSYGHIRIFGSEAYVHVPKEKRLKLDMKAEKMIFVGYAEGRKAYRFLDPETNRIVISRDAKFIERDGVTKLQRNRPEPTEVVDVGEGSSTSYVRLGGYSRKDVPPEPVVEAEEPEITETDESDGQLDESVYENASEGEVSFHGFPLDEIARRSLRVNKGVPPRRLIEEVFVAREEEMEPRTLKEALSCEDSLEWKRAMAEELKSHATNGTWDLVELPAGRKPVGCRWVYKRKRNAAGEIVKHKARLVAQGYCQKYGEDYDEVFAPVTKQTTLRALLAVASKRNLVLKHFDVKTAYLYGKLEEELYMKQPAGFEKTGAEKLVCRLRRSIYGLKQSARCWNHRLHAVLIGMEFKQSGADPCLYTKDIGGDLTYILVYVDDILVGSTTDANIQEIYNCLKKEFEMTDLGDLNYFLGLEVHREDGKYSVSLEGYIERVADRFGLRDAKAAKTPMDEVFVKVETESVALQESTTYRSLVGALLYIAVCARPDIAVSASLLGRRVASPTEADWTAAKRVVRYLKGTKNWRLHYGDGKAGLVAYSDADWAGDLKTRKSTSGMVFLLAGGAISWASRLQNCVTLSSMESEFVALSETSQEVVWLLHLLDDLGEAPQQPVAVMEDNQSCIKFVGSERVTRRSKHIETRECYVKELCNEGVLKLVYCPTEDMLADVLTKPLGAVKLSKLSSLLGLQSGIGKR